jgi:hypothetical protein
MGVCPEILVFHLNPHRITIGDDPTTWAEVVTASLDRWRWVRIVVWIALCVGVFMTASFLVRRPGIPASLPAPLMIGSMIGIFLTFVLNPAKSISIVYAQSDDPAGFPSPVFEIEDHNKVFRNTSRVHVNRPGGTPIGSVEMRGISFNVGGVITVRDAEGNLIVTGTPNTSTGFLVARRGVVRHDARSCRRLTNHFNDAREAREQAVDLRGRRPQGSRIHGHADDRAATRDFHAARDYRMPVGGSPELAPGGRTPRDDGV